MYAATHHAAQLPANQSKIAHCLVHFPVCDLSYLALGPKLDAPVSTAADEEIALEWRPLNTVDRSQVPTVCLQILF